MTPVEEAVADDTILSLTYPDIKPTEHVDAMGHSWYTFFDSKGNQLAPFSQFGYDSPRKWLAGFLWAAENPPRMFQKFGGY